MNGSGEIYTGMREGDVVHWNAPTAVKSGDVFAIDSGMAHQLKNTSGSENLVLLFCCPHAHLKDDRVITADQCASRAKESLEKANTKMITRQLIALKTKDFF